MAKNDYQKLQKLFMEFQDKSGEFFQYQIESRNGEGFVDITLPFDTDSYTPDYIKMKLFATEKDHETVEDYDKIQYLLNPAEEDKENKKWKRNSTVLNRMTENFLKNPDKGQKFPEFTYSDITETELFGYPPISSSDLMSDKKGIWSKNGFRKFELSVTGMPDYITNVSDCEVKISVFWHTIDSTPLKNLVFEEEIRYDKSKKKYYAYIDTNRLGEVIVQNKIESKHPRILGRFEIHNVLSDKKIVYSFPIIICLLNTEIDEKGNNDYLQSSYVSIDFGTSSTCAAVKDVGRNRLITLSGHYKNNQMNETIEQMPENEEQTDENTEHTDGTVSNINIYENPTNLLIYNWDEVFRQWDATNRNCPFFIKKDKEMEEKMADYDSGYTVLDEYQNVDEKDGTRKMEAIISELKMIPYLLSKGKEKKFVPYLDKTRATVQVIANVKEENQVKFSAIAFYGYLLGRAINNPAAGKLYRKYYITYPAKFNPELRDMICESLAYGINRALPEPLRNGKDSKGKELVEVSMKYSEPEACVGAFVGKQLKLGSEKAKLFAVYDLGGGTMDFAFGILRQAEGDELDEADQVIKIFGIDGDESYGGEKLIHQLAYKIYRDNQTEMEKNKIKFILPEGEHNPKGFDGLISEGDRIADINVNIFKERLARPLFKWKEETLSKLLDIVSEAVDAEHVRLTLKDAEDEDKDITIKVDGVDDFIKEKIDESITAFRTVLVKNFEKNKSTLAKYGIRFDEKQLKKNSSVEIFLGGNASKQHYVKELLEAQFQADKIHFIGEGQNDDNMSAEYNINSKTAVAFGQLSLGNYKIEQPAKTNRPPFEYNVCFIDSNDEIKTVIAKNEESGLWFKANRIDTENGTTNLYCTKNPTSKRESLIPVQHEIKDVEEYIEKKELTVYLRVYQQNIVEYRLGKNAAEPDSNETVQEDKLIVLG